MTDIKVDGLTKRFGEKTVLDDVSLIFRGGEITCIKGPSGCGKTTLLRILAGLETADGGSVSGVPGKVGFVFQEDRLSEDFSAVSNIRLVTGKTVPKSTIESHLREIGLGNDLTKPVREYSGGMKRRVAIVRAVLYGADILIMDEPFKGLDAELKRTIMDYVKKYTAGKTVLCVTHEPEEARYMGGILIDMEDLNK